MSTINTSGINANYPVPGENNSSQGFRDNFANIKTNFNVTAAEITDLQNKVVLKQALANSTLNNDMGGALISNATTRFFRSSTYNLGNALSGTVLVDVSLGDIQYGNVAGNVTFQFGGWAPINTESSVVLKLGISNPNAVITFPSEVTSTYSGFGVTILENYSNTGGVASITVPNGVIELDYQLTTIDCGNTIYVTPLNRPFQTTQVQQGIPISTGLRGDKAGAISFGPIANQVSITSTLNSDIVINAAVVSMPGSSINGTILTVGGTDDAVMDLSYISGTTLNVVTLSSGNIQIGMQLIGSGIAPGTTIVENLTGSGSGSTWRVSVLHSPTTLATTITGSTPIQPGMLLSGVGVLANTYIVSVNNGAGAGSTWNLNNSQVLAGPVTITGTTGIVGDLLYVGQIVSGTIAQGTILSGIGITANTTVVDNVTGSTSGSVWTVSDIQYAAPTTISGELNTIVANSTSNFYVDMPIVFTGNVFGNLVPGSMYYVKDVMTSTNFSVTLTPGGDGATYPVSTSTGLMYGDPVNYLYVCAQNYNGNVIGPKYVYNTYATSNFVKVDNVVNLEVNNPIIFTGSVFGGLAANVPFYIKSIDSGNGNITISRTIFNGIAGSEYELVTANSGSANACQAYSVTGPDVWRQIPLLPSTGQGSNITAANLTASENLTVFGDATVVGNLTVSGTTAYGNTSYVNIETTGNANLENIFANNITANTLTTNGVATFSDVSNVKIEGGLNGYYLQTDGTGNLSWVAGTTSPAPSTAAGSDTQVQYNDTGSFAGSPGFTFNDGSNTLSVAGNVNTGNVTANANITTENLTVNQIVSFSQVANIKLGDSDVGNSTLYLQSDGAGGLQWASGTVTPTGTGTSAGSNNQIQISWGNGDFKAAPGFTFDNSTNVFATPGNALVDGNIISNNNIFANSGTVGASLLTGTLTTAAQPNVTSIGTLTSLAVNGRVNANAVFANTGTSIDPDTVVGFGAGNIVEPVFSPLGSPGIVIGKTTGQHGAIMYTSGTMVFGTEDGNTNSLRRKANLYSNGTFEANYFIGTLLSSSQPSITQVGTLSSLNVTGNVSARNFTGNLANGTSNIRIPAAGGNINFSASANANVLIVSGLGANITGNLDVSSNIIVDNANSGIFAGYVTANGNTYGNLDISSNVSGNLGFRGLSTVYTDNSAANNGSITQAAAHAISGPTFAAVGNNVTLSNAATFAITGEPVEGVNVNLDPNNSYALYVNGKSLFESNIIHNGEMLETGNVTASGNITTANLSVTNLANLGSNAIVKISGGNVGEYLQTDGAGGLSWAAGTVVSNGSGAANGAAGLVQFARDGTGNFGAAAGFTFSTASNTLSVPGNLVATSGRITAANFVGQISNLSPAQSNITSVGTLVSLTVGGNLTVSGSNAGIKSAYVTLNQDGYGNVNIANIGNANTNLGFRINRNRYFDTVSVANAVVGNSAIHLIGQPKLAASSTNVTATNATTFFIEGAPVANTNMTITNGYALWSNGQSRIGGNLQVDGNLVACANVSFTKIEDMSIGNTSSYAGYYLRAVGNGALEWSSGTVVSTGITAAGNTTDIQFNYSGSVTGSNAFTFTYTSGNTEGNLLLNGNANITGNLTVGDVIYNNAKGTVGQILAIYANGLTYWTTPSTSATIVANGTSNISIPNSGGNIEINGTVANYILLSGNALALSDFSVGANTANRVKYQGTPPASISFLKAGSNGNTYWSTDAGSIIANSTSNVSIPVIDGNIALAVAGTIRGNVTTSGLNMTGTLIAGGVTYTNVAGTNGQVLQINGSGVTSWVNPSSVLQATNYISNGNSNVKIVSAGANVVIDVNGTTGVVNIGTANSNFAGNINASSNIVATNQLIGANGTIGNLTANAYIIGTGSIITDANTTRTLSATDNGKILYFTSNSANITLTTASGLGAGFSVLVIQAGDKRVTVTAGAGSNRRSFGNAYSTAGQYATISVICPVANEFFVSGQTAA